MPGIIERDVIFEGLNQIVSSPLHPSGKMFYGVENFDGVNWEGIPLIIADSREHIDYARYLENQQKELNKRNARVIGHVRGAYPYDYTAQHLSGSSSIFDDPANGLIDSGKLGISTDFTCNFTNKEIEGETIGALAGKITPNYVHCWEKEIQNEQNDIVARFMNSTKEGDIMTETQQSGGLESALEKFVGVFSKFFESLHESQRHTNSAQLGQEIPAQVGMTMTDIQVPDIDAIKTEYETKVASIETEKTTLQSQIEELNAKITEREAADIASKQAALETQWSTAIMPKFLPATFHEEGTEAEMKKLYLEAPHEFIVKYGDLMNKTVIDAQHQNSSSRQHQNSNLENNDSIPSVGSYDASTGGWI